MNLYNIVWFLVAAISAALPIPLIKEYTLTKNCMWIILSIFIYCILVLSYSIVLVDKNIIIVYPILKVLSAMIVVLSGVVFFNNKLDFESIIGILLGIITIYILSGKINEKK